MPVLKWKPRNVSSHSFEFINVADFHDASIWAHTRYAWLWITIFKTILVFCGDLWICIVLIISSTWTLDIKPVISVSIARWIFAVSLLSSCVLWAFDLRKSNKIIKRKEVSSTVSNTMASRFYCLQDYDYFCFINKITSERMLYFVFYELQGWKYLILKAPRNIISIMVVVALLQTIEFDFGRLNEMDTLLPHLKGMDKLAFCAMAFTSLMFILSVIAALVAAMLWIFFFKKHGNLRDYVWSQMNKSIDAVIKKSTTERARQSKILEEMEDKEAERPSRSSGTGSCSSESGSFTPLTGNSCKKSPTPAPQRLKPTLPDIDAILANSGEDIQVPSRSQCSNRRILQTDQHAHHCYDEWYRHYSLKHQPSVRSVQSDHASFYNTHRNRYSYHQERQRQPSLTSVGSIRTDRSFPMQYSRSAGCSPYLQPASLVPSYQQRQRCLQESRVERPRSVLLPLQGQHYHDPRPHTPELVTLNDHSEYWPLHYGLVSESSISETHSAPEELALQRPDSEVLPETNDPYYMHANRQGHHRRQGSAIADGSPSSRRDMAEVEQSTVSSRSVSIASRSSRTSQQSCTTFESSYATALRQEKLQQQKQQPWDHYKLTAFLSILQSPNRGGMTRCESSSSDSSSEESDLSQPPS